MIVVILRQKLAEVPPMQGVWYLKRNCYRNQGDILNHIQGPIEVKINMKTTQRNSKIGLIDFGMRNST
eukprot:snap_masked-scaffold_26-processed-gene-3.50-mRNA-1 protein AED:1.00 eAED:1.00 QI:0/-1/0/0/-1/1/1/0/67